MDDGAHAAGDTWRYTVPARARERDEVAARLWAAGARGVWERGEDLVAWFAEPSQQVPPGGCWAAEQERDWNEEWKSGLEPVEVGPFAIVPSWLAEETRIDPERIPIVLDPGAAFGSGHHATTRMCLEEVGAMEMSGRSVLDVGTGSGILAIAAAHRGAAEVVAVDSDPRAVETARDNIERAGVTVHLAVGSLGAVPGGPFDLVLANLLTDTLLELYPELIRTVAPGGDLVVSGVTAARRKDLVAAVGATGLDDPVAVRERDGWVLLRWRRDDDTLGGDTSRDDTPPEHPATAGHRDDPDDR